MTFTGAASAKTLLKPKKSRNKTSQPRLAPGLAQAVSRRNLHHHDNQDDRSGQEASVEHIGKRVRNGGHLGDDWDVQRAIDRYIDRGKHQGR